MRLRWLLALRPQHFSRSVNPEAGSNINVSGTFLFAGTIDRITVPMKVHREGSGLHARERRSMTLEDDLPISFFFYVIAGLFAMVAITIAIAYFMVWR